MAGKRSWVAIAASIPTTACTTLSRSQAAVSQRVAWRRTGGGRTECMLAFRMIGNGLDHDNIVDSSAMGVFAMIPEFIGTFLDTITGTLGRHLACKASCALRKVAFEPNKYPYTKISTSVDKY
mmetsp:Transcript_136341/g.192811  ORF Transcript_136341/g.192811 Transcript_136341/m.192811 type:complete len:123 (-) Transcript_136341:37-405(-)